MRVGIHFADVEVSLNSGRIGGPWDFWVPPGSAMAVEAPASAADAVVRLCTGSLAPASGEVTVLGERPWALPRFARNRLLRRMGVAFHREGLVSNLSLEDNLVVPMVFGGSFSRGEARERAREAIRQLGLEPFRTHRPGALSREARFSAALARAVLRNPEVLVLEHLPAGLPASHRAEVLGWCRERCDTMLVLVPGPSRVLDDLGVAWLPSLEAPREEGGAP